MLQVFRVSQQLQDELKAGRETVFGHVAQKKQLLAARGGPIPAHRGLCTAEVPGPNSSFVSDVSSLR